MEERTICKKSLLLGLGAGIIVTSLVSLIYLSGRAEEPSKEELIKFASENGYKMVSDDGGKVLPASTPTFHDVKVKTEDTKPPTNDKLGAIVEEEKLIDFEIRYGDSSDKVARNLYNKGIISNTDDFERVLESKRIEHRLQVGRYKIKPSISLDELASILTTVRN